MKTFTLKNDDGTIVEFEAENDAKAIKIAESIIKLFNETEEQKPN